MEQKVSPFSSSSPYYKFTSSITFQFVFNLQLLLHSIQIYFIHHIYFAKSKAMQSSEFSELRYPLFPQLPSQFPPQFPLAGINPPAYHHHFNSPYPNHNLIQELSPQPVTCCFSSNSTSDEGDEQQLNIINERKQRRMISNRESARRSRMRKQKHLDELWSQVVCLRNENSQLLDRLNDYSERYDQVVQENCQLKEEASELRQTIVHMQLNSPFEGLPELDDDRSMKSSLFMNE
ncbi:basic leucine zipper 43-like [Primulina tabacum]|uniref:basic leucine zipper 43-like n=1 Tax=Primulina tabacum TaxID=48773 RepID=UPI003F5A8E7A